MPGLNIDSDLINRFAKSSSLPEFVLLVLVSMAGAAAFAAYGIPALGWILRQTAALLVHFLQEAK